jgi:hypothetical protein
MVLTVSTLGLPPARTLIDAKSGGWSRPPSARPRSRFLPVLRAGDVQGVALIGGALAP